MGVPVKSSASAGIRNRIPRPSDPTVESPSVPATTTTPTPLSHPPLLSPPMSPPCQSQQQQHHHHEYDGKIHGATARPPAVLLSRIVVSLLLLSVIFLALAFLRDTAASLSPLRDVVLARLSSVRRVWPQGHTLRGHASGRNIVGTASHRPADVLSVHDYPTILVDDSAPFNPAPRPEAGDADVARDDNVQSIIVTAHSEDEVTPVSKDREASVGDAGDDTAARLIVITMDRAKSLRRLLNSLVAANYGEDVVDLDVWIDKPKDGGPINADILSICRNLTWRQGTKTIHKRTQNAGLYKQWIYTWNITAETTEFAVILEDDLEVSPAFYQWLRVARAAYAQDPDVAAFTLQRSTLRPRQRKGIASGNLRIPKEAHVFKYRLLGTWGFAPQRDQWVEFRKWFEAKRARNEKPYVDGLMTTSWYKRQEKDGFAPNMWSQWWIKFVDEKNYFTITGHLPDGTTLAANWRESGLHYSKNEPKADFPVYRGSADQFVMPDNPIVVDWDGLIIRQNVTGKSSASGNSTSSSSS